MDTGSRRAPNIKMMYPCGIGACRVVCSSYDEMMQHTREGHLARLSEELVGQRKYIKISPGVWRDTSRRLMMGRQSSQLGNSTSITGSTTDPSIEIPSFDSVPPPLHFSSLPGQQRVTAMPTSVILGSQPLQSQCMAMDFDRSPSPEAGPSHSTPLDERLILPPTQSQDIGAYPPSSPFVPVTQPPPATQARPDSLPSSDGSQRQTQTESAEQASVSYHSESSKQYAHPKPRPSPQLDFGRPTRPLGFGMALSSGSSFAAPKRTISQAGFGFGAAPRPPPSDGSPEQGRADPHPHPASPSIQRGVSFDWAKK